MATDVARLALAIDVTGAKRAQSAMEALQSGSVRLTRATDEQIAAQRRLTSTYNSGGAAMGRFSGRLRGLGRGFRVQKGSTAQFGQQLQDITIQAQMGTSAFTILAQQGGQVASLFGPGGALLGAIIAIGGALGGAYFASTTRAAESTKTLTERIGELRDNVDELTQAQIEGLKVEFFQANRERAKAINSEKENIRDLTEELVQLQNAERAAEEQGNAAVLGDLREEIKETSGDLRIARGELQTFYDEADADAKKLDELIHGTDETGNSAEDAAEKIREMVEAAEQQAITIGLSARATATYEAAIAGATAEQILAIDTAYRRIEASKEEQQQAKEAAQQERALAAMRAEADPAFAEFNRYADQIDQIEQFNITAAEKERLREAAFAQHQQRMAKLAGQGGTAIAQANQSGLQMLTSQQQTALGAIGQIFGNMAAIAEKGGKDQFNTWKALASAQAAVSTALAISNALAVPPAPVGIALASTIGALGAVQIGQIQAAEYQPQGSYLGGGFTGTGSRTGGVDGRGGFPAVLHPNETVIDHTKGQGMGVGTVINIHNAPPGARTEERTDNNGRQVVDIFLSDVSSGGPMSKAMQGTFGLRRQGR